MIEVYSGTIRTHIEAPIINGGGESEVSSTLCNSCSVSAAWVLPILAWRLPYISGVEVFL